MPNRPTDPTGTWPPNEPSPDSATVSLPSGAPSGTSPTLTHTPDGATTDFAAGAPGGAELSSVPGHELLGEIARGGMGAVFRARDSAFAREVAVKIINDPREG